MTKPCKLAPNVPTPNGYSYIQKDGIRKGAHVWALEEKLGRPLWPGYEACHTCDVRNCIEPEHLYEGTHSENMLDAHRKGRAKGRGWFVKTNLRDNLAVPSGY